MLRRPSGLTLAVVFFWLVMTGLFLYRIYESRPNTVAGPPLIPDAPTETWMAIYVGDANDPPQIGYVHTSAIPGVRNGGEGLDYRLKFKLDTHMFGQQAVLELTGSSWVDATAGIQSFDFVADSGSGHVLNASGIVDDNQLKIELETGGETFPLSFPVDPGLMVRAGFGTTTLNLPGLEVGDTVSVDAFDPVSMGYGKAYITCIDTEMLEVRGERVLTKILETDLSGITSKTWVTLDEEVVKVESPLGFTLKAVTEAEALQQHPEPEPGDEPVLEELAVRPEGLRPFRGAQRMRFRVDELPPKITPVLSSHQRLIEPGVFEITVPALNSEIDEKLSNPAEYLQGGPFVQVGQERIVERAESLASPNLSRWEQASAISRWLYEAIDKRPVMGFPSAIEVLATQEGDCNEHTVLFAALSRSVEIPTRIAIGLVWSEEMNGFYYHAWPEIFDGQWIPLEPTLGQDVADATHITLLYGGIQDWPKLAPFLGNIQLEILEIE